MIGTNFHHYSVAYGVISARFRTFIIRFRLTFPYRKQGLPGRDELGFHTLSVKHTLDCTPCNHEDIGLVNGFIGLGLDFD